MVSRSTYILYRIVFNRVVKFTNNKEFFIKIFTSSNNDEKVLKFKWLFYSLRPKVWIND